MMALFLLSAATLTFEINLSRLFAVAQFYHFAFMTVSIALLGFGASGTVLATLPRLVQKEPEVLLGWLSLASGLSMLAAYLLTNLIPFELVQPRLGSTASVDPHYPLCSAVNPVLFHWHGGRRASRSKATVRG